MPPNGRWVEPPPVTGSPPILKVGLTGGVASGKSTVAAMLSEQGAFVVDADRLVHEITLPGRAEFDDVVSRFGSEILDNAGHIDRGRLGQIVFVDEEARRTLENIIHPGVRAETARRFEHAAREWNCRIGVFDAALLVETGAYRDFHRLIVVRCERETQIGRLRERNGLSRSNAELRLAAQAPLEPKLAVADYVIDTEGSRLETREQTARIYAQLQSDFDREFLGT
jgi:dephospho-CoA kinase